MPLPNITRFCGAKTDNGPCPQPAMPNGRCYKHGGATPSGVASPHFVHGRRSRSLPARMAASYEESLADPSQLASRADIATLDARIEDLLERVDTGESGEIWKSLRATYAVAEKAREIRDKAGDGITRVKAEQEFFQAFETIGVLIAEGHADYLAWDEVKKAMESRRALVETEMKRVEKAGRILTAEQAAALMGAMTALVREHVTDRNALAAISAGLDRIAAGAGGAGT